MLTDYSYLVIEARLDELAYKTIGAIGRALRLPRCYVSGPMTGLPYFNFPAFEKAAELLRGAGWFVYSPRENDLEKGLEPDPEGRQIQGEYTFKDLMKTDLWQVCDSDAVFVLPGWEYSEGALLEVDVAHRVGVPVYSLLSGRKIESEARAPHEFSSKLKTVKVYTTEGDMHVTVPAEQAAHIEGQMVGLDDWLEDVYMPTYSTSPAPTRITFTPALDFGPEWRDTDEATGGSKGRKQATFANMSLVADVYEARVHGFGVMKYPDEQGAPNWSRGMPWSWFYDALRRHIAEFWNGDNLNPESGLPHLAHARWMISNLIEYMEYGLGTDDRPTWRRESLGGSDRLEEVA